MDPGVQRLFYWWGTFVAGLLLVTVGFFGYVLASESLRWYGTPVVSADEARDEPLATYVRVEGRIALNASEDIIAVQHIVKKAFWTTDEYEYRDTQVYLEDAGGGAILMILDHVSTTRPGPHAGDYYKGDHVCAGGYVTVDAAGRRALRVDYLGKHINDAPARFIGYYYTAMLGGMALVILFAVGRLFLKPRRQGGPGWRGT